MSSLVGGPARPPKPEAIQSIPQRTSPQRQPAVSQIGNLPRLNPAFLDELSEEDLSQLLNSPELLDAVLQAHHPSPAQNIKLLAGLEQELQEATSRVSKLRQQTVEKRLEVENSLIETKDLENEWEAAELNMYASLKPFSSSALFTRLKAYSLESEKLAEFLESSFLGETPSDQTEGVQDFIKEYRSARKTFHLRNERLARWKDGRVGGFR